MEDLRCGKFPIWLWPNVLSVDAPFVAVLWQILLAQIVRIQLGWAEPLVLFLAVWTIYIADRILDSFSHPPQGWEPERKRFYRNHRLSMSLACATIGVSALLLVNYCLAVPEILRLGLLLSLSVIGYFAAVHAFSFPSPGKWPRELTVSLIFSVGTFGPLAFFHPPGFQMAACSLIFSLLCWVNCSLIETREWRHNTATRHPGGLASFVEGRVDYVLAATVILAAVFAFLGYLSVSFFAAAVSAALALHWLALRNSRVSARFFRVAADGALCSPLLVLLAVRLA